MKIIKIDTNNRQQVRKFLDLPFRLYKDVDQWVPPLRHEARLMLNREKHPFYKHSDADFFLAVEDSRVLGRIAVLENRNYNDYNNSKTGFFYLYECDDNPNASLALFDAVSSWSIDRGLSEIIGPKGFSVFDGSGLLVEGYKHRPAFGLPYNLPYYSKLIGMSGYMSIRDIVSGYLDERIQFPDQIHRIAELVKKRRGLKIARFENHKDLKKILPQLRDLYNASLGGTEDNVPLTADEVKTLADQMLWFADPKLLKIVLKGNQAVGFLFAYPDVSAAVQRIGGRLFPFGWAHLLYELKRTKWININGAGMAEGYRGIGGTAILFSEMYKSVVESRYRYADIVQIGTENDNMQREMNGLGIEFYKTHRLYKTDLEKS